MIATPRMRGLIAPALAVAALLFALQGCEEDTKPKITRLTATPECDELKTITRVNLDPIDSSIVSIDTLGVWMQVTFFARAASGNELSEPTGANSPLEWTWDFGDNSPAVKNVVGPVHRYTEAGEYNVRLTVKDDDGDTDTANLVVRVGEAYTDLDILDVWVTPASELRFTTVPGSIATDLSQAWGEQVRLQRMDMVFDGHLTTICNISGLFEQYLWEWTIANPDLLDTITIIDRNPVRLRYTPQNLELTAQLRVVESVTGMERSFPRPGEIVPRSGNPVGIHVGNSIPRTALPNAKDTLDLHGYLLGGVKELTFELEWADSAATLDDVTFNPIIALGFDAAWNQVGPGRAAISLTSASGFPTSAVTSPIADLEFTTKPVVPGPYPVRVRNPHVMRDGDPAEGGLITKIDGMINLDSDCDGDLVPDSFQVEFYPDEFDCNGNGIHDACDIAAGTSPDENGNGIPDECES